MTHDIALSLVWLTAGVLLGWLLRRPRVVHHFMVVTEEQLHELRMAAEKEIRKQAEIDELKRMVGKVRWPR